MESFADGFEEIPNGAHVLQAVIFQLDVELLFALENEFDDVQTHAGDGNALELQRPTVKV